MIDPKQIPDEVVKAGAKELAHTNGWRSPQGIYACEPVARDIVAAALAAWPNAILTSTADHLLVARPALILPLQKDGE